MIYVTNYDFFHDSIIIMYGLGGYGGGYGGYSGGYGSSYGGGYGGYSSSYGGLDSNRSYLS
jgi:hypothetical protein